MSRLLLLASKAYTQRVLGTACGNLLAYWPLWELSGTTARNLEGTTARNGTYTGVTFGDPGIGDGSAAPFFDGANDLVNVYSTSFRDAFNSAEGTASLWVKVNSSSVWTDGTARRFIHLFAASGNFIRIDKPTTNNTIQYIYAAGGTTESVTKSSMTATGWFHLALTWSKSADQVKTYFNGAQEGATQTTLGVFAGNLTSDGTVIGAQNTTPTNVHHGYIAHVAVWNTPLTSAQIARLAQVT